VPKATKRERQRQNRDARRAAMQAEEKRRRRFRTIRLFAIIIAAAVALAFLVSLISGGGGDSKEASGGITCTNKKPSNPPTTQQFSEPPPMTIDPTATYTVTLDTNCGQIPITMDAASAPQSVNNFVFLAQQGFYDGTTFHRIVTDFVDQGGDPTGTGNGGPGYDLPDEPASRAYKGGDVAMARATAVSGSQFFLVVSNAGGTQLGGPPGQYNLIGTMSKQGLKVAQKINTFGASDTTGTPTKQIYVFSTTVSGPTTTSSTTTTAAP
jgi:cyclophilin family peptidyl-prolyl cis-trans isomerase